MPPTGRPDNPRRSALYVKPTVRDIRPHARYEPPSVRDLGAQLPAGVASGHDPGSGALRKPAPYEEPTVRDIVPVSRSARAQASDRAETRILTVFRIPIWAMLVFVLTMLSVYFLGLEVIDYYQMEGILF